MISSAVRAEAKSLISSSCPFHKPLAGVSRPLIENGELELAIGPVPAPSADPVKTK